MFSCKNINIPRNFLREHCLKSNLLIRYSAIQCIHMRQPLATAKRVTFVQNILYENYSKFRLKKCSLKKFLKILIFQRKYMEMCFHGNKISWALKHHFINPCFKYHYSCFIHLFPMLAPVISSLDEIYCTSLGIPHNTKYNTKWH